MLPSTPVPNEPNNSEPQLQNNSRPFLNPEGFYGRAHHKDILNHLLEHIQPVNFHQIIGKPAEDSLLQRNMIYAVVKHLLQISEEKKWNFCKRYDGIYIFNGAYWKQHDKEEIKKFLGDVAVQMGMKDYDAKHFEFSDKLFKQFVSDACISTRVNDSNRVLINLQNGTAEFTRKGCNLRDFRQEDFLTNQLPFSYNVDVTCPLFNTYLNRVLPDESSQMVLQEFAGYIFTNLKLEKCLILTGLGENGKTVFFDVINALLGADNTLSYSFGLFREPYNRAQLVNKLLNYSDEKGFDLDPDILKALITGSGIQACNKYKDPFTLYNLAKFILNCNQLPKLIEHTHAFYRRLIILPFDVKITEEEKDVDLSRKIISNELPGVFNWALAGLNRLLLNGKFTYCKRSEDALNEFIVLADTLKLFIEDYNYKTSDNNMSLAEIYREYKNYCQESTYKPLGKHNFSKRLQQLGFEKVRKNDGFYFFMEKKDFE
jgi:putative DNA primase/helicase